MLYHSDLLYKLARGQHCERLERRRRERLARQASSLKPSPWQHLVWIAGELLISAGRNLQANRNQLAHALQQPAGEAGCD